MTAVGVGLAALVLYFAAPRVLVALARRSERVRARRGPRTAGELAEAGLQRANARMQHAQELAGGPAAKEDR